MRSMFQCRKAQQSEFNTHLAWNSNREAHKCIIVGHSHSTFIYKSLVDLSPGLEKLFTVLGLCCLYPTQLEYIG